MLRGQFPGGQFSLGAIVRGANVRGAIFPIIRGQFFSGAIALEPIVTYTSI